MRIKAIRYFETFHVIIKNKESLCVLMRASVSLHLHLRTSRRKNAGTFLSRIDIPT